MPYTSFSVPKSLVKEYEKVADAVREIYPDYDFKIHPLEPRDIPKTPGGTDATVFMTKGIPAQQMNEHVDTKGYNFSYYEIWHTERDTFDKSIPEYQNQAAATMAIMVLGTANLSTQWPRNEVYK
jgi:hypothetical protein